MKCATEVGLALKKRIEKNRDKLFTFLDYDGVPWNNNNAEHAVRAFTRLRNVINTSTPKGTREYATLLSIQQTLRYRGMGFLEFMRSGRMEIDDDRTAGPDVAILFPLPHIRHRVFQAPSVTEPTTRTAPN